MKEHCQKDKKKNRKQDGKVHRAKKKKLSFRFVLTKPLEPNMLQ